MTLFRSIRMACLAAVAVISLGCTVHVHVTIPTPRPVAPAPIAQAPAHKGHFTVSYIEPRYPSPASAAVRGQLAGEDWAALDATFRSYTEGQGQLTTLGFVGHFRSADLPIAFLQEDGPGGAPIIGSFRSPASGDAVLAWVKEFRGP